jgi:uncharacterized protein (UPF0332 family)
MNQDVIRYRWQRSAAALHMAELCCSNFHCNDAVNRAYFAAYYAVAALLAAHGLEFHGHDEAVKLFEKDFVVPGMITASSGETFRGLAARRAEVDYQDFKDANAEEVQKWLAGVRGLIGEVNDLMQGKPGNDLY